MNITDGTYRQKSKLFLLPLIEIPKNQYIKPIDTYVIDQNRELTEKECRLILPFEKDESSEFSYYERTLVDSKYFDTANYYETKDHRVYVYDLTPFKADYDLFLAGKYTEFTNTVKTLINIYWGKLHKGKFIPHPQIEAYLSPSISTYEEISEELNLPISSLIEVKQLLDPPNLEKETFHSLELIGNKTS